VVRYTGIQTDMQAAQGVQQCVLEPHGLSSPERCLCEHSFTHPTWLCFVQVMVQMPYTAAAVMQTSTWLSRAQSTWAAMPYCAMTGAASRYNCRAMLAGAGVRAQGRGLEAGRGHV
jgi:hypothetical protein